jgi:hypothetical protein
MEPFAVNNLDSPAIDEKAIDRSPHVGSRPSKINWRALAHSIVKKSSHKSTRCSLRREAVAFYRLCCLRTQVSQRPHRPTVSIWSCRARRRPRTSTVSRRRSGPGLPTEQHYSQAFTAGNTRRSRVKRTTPARRRQDGTSRRRAVRRGVRACQM